LEVISSLSSEELLAFIDYPDRVKEFAADLAREAAENVFFEALTDEQAIGLLTPTGEGVTSEEVYAVENMVRKWRQEASELNFNSLIAWKVRAGFSLTEHAPRIGPCYKRFEDVAQWNLENHEPTVDSVVFWIPRLVPYSLNKNAAEQMQLLAELRQGLELPVNHLNSFGSAALLAGLVLSHNARTGERVPERDFFVRTDTAFPDIGRLRLSFYPEDGVTLDRSPYNSGCHHPKGGCFPIAVHPLVT
jgi:hypothetical protein